MNSSDNALLRYLNNRSPTYRAKLVEARDEISKWLSYVPQTFPHYTQHTIEHSDAILSKLSKMLFVDDDPSRPLAELSAIEVYILAAAAYLHDAGMVASDLQKAEILSSDQWKAWCGGDGYGADRWRRIQQFRSEKPDDPLHHFVADRQVRFLIAEFIRRNHHQRSADVIAQHAHALGRFDYDDDVLRTAISDVCVSHGLERSELNDRERFPDRREIRGEVVNIRFLAIQLRIGDLLDMRSDRACPLLLAAACPLPADSFAHWSQYRRISHELVAHDRIELTADCDTQEEHRFLNDWCQWLVDEVHSATSVLANAARHRGWRPPQLSIGDGTGSETIVIRPSKRATYIPRKWQFEFDHSAVFERLIGDIYDQPNAFIRELVQNALDAMRCQLSVVLRSAGNEPPEFINEVEESIRQGFRLRISLSVEDVPNPLSGVPERRQVLSIDDCGIGMDQEVIERYFLQVGRSYYQTDSFRRSFSFHPVSRFGIGFLSVFAVSDHVVVETLKTYGQPNPAPIRLTLSGPKGYLLVEKGSRVVPGTTISVRLNKMLEPGKLLEQLRELCRRVEFPIEVTDLDRSETVECERSDQFVGETPDPEDPDVKLVVRAIPVNLRGLTGELYVNARLTAQGESWADGFRIYEYRERYPFADLPLRQETLLYQQGLMRIRDGRGLGDWNFGCRLDDRRPFQRDVVDRGVRQTRSETYEMLRGAWESVIRNHLAQNPLATASEGWKYVHRLARAMPAHWWASVEGAVPVWTRGTMQRRVAADIVRQESFLTLSGEPRRDRNHNWFFPLQPNGS